MWISALILLLGFAVRLHNLEVPDLNIDETWSYIHSYFLGHPSGYTVSQILSPEPNNALHLILASAFIYLAPGAFGIRWLSLSCGVLIIALAMRIAYRLYGRRASLIAGLIVSLASASVYYSQIARPYMLTTLLGLLSLLFWLEKRPRLNMIASIFVPLAHIAAMPIIVVQDMLTLARIGRGQRVNKLDWIIRRIPVYGMFLLVVYMTYLRRDIHVISSGQSPPSPSEVLYHALNAIHNGFPVLTPGAWLFLGGVIAPLLIAVVFYRRLPRNLDLPLLWIAATYGFLIAGAVLSDGPIKWLHISHVAIAIALLMAAVLSRVPRASWIVLIAFVVANGVMLIDYYQQPYHYLKSTRMALDSFRRDDEAIYVLQPTILWALQVNNPDAPYITWLPEEAERPSRYLYVNRPGWPPAAPAECEPEPLWSDSIDLELLRCNHG
jgi:hypothetical protein